MKTTNARSFSASVKEELIRMPAGRACCMLSEISALTQTSGHLSFRGGGWISASWRMDNAGTARRLFQLLKKRLNVTPSLHFIQTKQLGGRRTCVLTLGTEDTRTLEKLLEKNGLPFRSYFRRGQQVIYLKDAQQISDTLAMMGAGSSVLEMENIRIRKQLRASAVRAANCDEHNSEKMLDAGLKQAEAIRQISLKQGLFTLPPALREIARLRVENPDLSLQQLGEMLDPPVGKSGANHRMRRLMEIADQLDKDFEVEEENR